MTTGFIWDERYAWHQQGIMPLGPDAEPFPGPDTPETKRRIYTLLQTSGLARELTPIEPRPATDAELERLHDAAYIARVRQASDAGGGSVGETVSIGGGGFDIAALAAGGCLAAVDAVFEGRIDNAYALVRPAGHHAEAGRGRGFCVFGNTALAALHARAAHGVARLAVVDWDVHHGNGTEDAFYDDPGVLTISLHQDGNYPEGRGGIMDRGDGDGFGANINIPLPPGSGHGAYIETIDKVVLPTLRSYRPELILIASGVDASVRDPMGRMLLGGETFRTMTERLMDAAADLCAGRLVACHEGGYAPTHAPFCTLAIIETLAGHRTGVVDPVAARLERLPGTALQPAQAAVIERAATLAPDIPGGVSRA
ncbi:MAG: class II histone deacetylase [Geminicoccaceae bacterium]